MRGTARPTGIRAECEKEPGRRSRRVRPGFMQTPSLKRGSGREHSTGQQGTHCLCARQVAHPFERAAILRRPITPTMTAYWMAAKPIR